ncbi:MAG: serine hydrolase domain-containing protein [Acidimicrobiales bacterium]
MAASTRTIVSERVDELLRRCRQDVDQGVLPSCQVALALEGEVVVEEAFGAATTATRYAVFSSTKPFVASVVWQLIAEGAVDPAKRVAEYLPEFATNGKDVITVEQVMLHTSGFPAAPLGPPEWSTSAGRRKVFERWRLNWEPGTRFEYHPTSAHWVLAEIINAVTNKDYRDELEARVTGPLGLPRVLGIAPGDQHHIALLEVCGEPATPEELEKAIGIRELPVTEVTDAALVSFNHQDVRAVGVPGGGGIMRASDLARFYQGLLHNPGGIWDPALLADVTGRVRNTFPDPMLGVSANRALGVIVAGSDGKSNYRGLGHTVSPRAFGHNGAAEQIAWADPETGLSFGYCTNGIDAHMLRQWRRGSAVASRAGLCTTPV